MSFLLHKLVLKTVWILQATISNLTAKKIFLNFGTAIFVAVEPSTWLWLVSLPARRTHTPGGNSHMKQTGMLVVSFRGINFGFWSRLGCSGKASIFQAAKVSFRVVRKNTELREEKEKLNFLFSPFFFYFLAVSFRSQNLQIGLL